MIIFPAPAYMACAECGACVAVHVFDDHVCDPARWVDFQIVKLSPGIRAFERDLAEWVATPAGRFALYLAARS